MQVAADALALGDARHLHDRRLGHAQTPILPAHLGELDVGRADGRANRPAPAASPSPVVPSHSACAVIETSISASQPNASRGGSAKPRKAIA